MSIKQKYAISVIIPTYKPEKYIIECFQSIDNQSFNKKEFEVIIVLNGVREPYFSFLDEYLLKCEFNYILFFTDLKGVSRARNIGIERSKGRYIAFIDDDDLVSEDYLIRMYDIAKNDVIPLSYMESFSGNINNKKKYYINNVYEKRFNKNNKIYHIRSYFSSACYKLISREIIGSYKFDLRFQNGEDALFMFAISGKNYKYGFTDRSAVYYRRIRNETLSTKNICLINRLKNSLNLMLVTIEIFFKSPAKYDILFFISRTFAYYKTIFIRLKVDN